MHNALVEVRFRPLSFVPRPVPVATDLFDFETWKRNPSQPIVLKGKLSNWPLFQDLKQCNTEEARLDYLGERFGDNVVNYTRIPASDPFMGYDDRGTQNFQYAPARCKVSQFCTLMRTALKDPSSDVFYARGGANSVRTWPKFSEAIRPLDFLKGMTPNGEGIWLGNGRHVTYLHQDAHFNFFAMVAGVKRVILYPLEAVANLYPTPFYGGIAGTTSSYVRPDAPDLEKFPLFANAAEHSWVAQIEDGDLLCIPPCWWHHVEAAPGINLMINTFVWALPPTKEYEFEVLMRKSIRAALGVPKEELSRVRSLLYQESEGEAPAYASQSKAAGALREGLSRFLQPEIPRYWQTIAKCYYDHYIFQLNGHPVAAHPERHEIWTKHESKLMQRFRQRFRFSRSVIQMMWRRRQAKGVVPD